MWRPGIGTADDADGAGGNVSEHGTTRRNTAQTKIRGDRGMAAGTATACKTHEKRADLAVRILRGLESILWCRTCFYIPEKKSLNLRKSTNLVGFKNTSNVAFSEPLKTTCTNTLSVICAKRRKSSNLYINRIMYKQIKRCGVNKYVERML